MLQPINFEQNNVVGFQLSGKIIKDEVEPILTEIKTKLDQHGKVRLYIEFAGIDSVSWEAMKAQSKFKFNVDSLNDFEKLVYVSDSTLLKVGSFLADLFPGIQAKHFSSDEKTAARDWIIR